MRPRANSLFQNTRTSRRQLSRTSRRQRVDLLSVLTVGR